MIYLSLFVISFCGVSVRAFQQLNVAHKRYFWIVPTSYLFGVFEVLLIANVANYQNLFMTVLALGTGGWAGCYFSLFVNGKLKQLF